MRGWGKFEQNSDFSTEIDGIGDQRLDFAAPPEGELAVARVDLVRMSAAAVVVVGETAAAEVGAAGDEFVAAANFDLDSLEKRLGL